MKVNVYYPSYKQGILHPSEITLPKDIKKAIEVFALEQLFGSKSIPEGCFNEIP